ncbi:MAG: polysaccharide deacetylase family protein [Pirellulaceae bacterium]|nr:polysaccharide deacetylase family protein [Pirellulaceae bacterium]
MNRFTVLVLLVWSLSPCFTQAQDRKQLIIHADDAGMSHSVNVATIDALEKGIVTSASIMVPCPWFKEFAQYAKAHPQYDYGIHLTLNSEWDVYRWGSVAGNARVPSLIDPEGYLWDGTDQVKQHAKADEVRIELKAQIDRALAFGVPLSHLDTHMGSLMTRPDLIEVYVQLGLEYKLPVLFFKRLAPEAAKAYPALADRQLSAAAKLTAAGLPMLDNLLQFYGGDNPAKRLETYRQSLRQLPNGVTALLIHCGIDNAELQGITSSSARRDQDYRIFTDPEIGQFINQQGIELTTWKTLHREATGR